MRDYLAEAIGQNEADTVRINPTLAFNFLVGLTDPDSPRCQFNLDRICRIHGGMVEYRHEDTKVPCNDAQLFTTYEGTLALVRSDCVSGLRLKTEFADETHIYGIKLGRSKRSYDGRIPVETEIPYRAPPCYD